MTRLAHRRRCGPVAALAVLGAVVLSGAKAHAEGDAASRALAVQLFDQAEARSAKRQVAEACPKYAESFRLDPQLGALIYLAECYEANGQLASAWGSFRQAEEMAQRRGDARGAHARERANALQTRMDQLVIEVPSASLLPGLEVLRDGVSLSAASWSNPSAIDEGKHQVEARAPGYLPWKSEVDVAGEGKSFAIQVPRLNVDPRADAGTAVRRRDLDNRSTTERVAAIALGGVGIVGLGVGGFFGLSAQSSYSESSSLCNAHCSEHGTELRANAKTKALVSTIATGAGAAAVIAAAVLWFNAPQGGGDRAPVATREAPRWSWSPKSDAWGLEVSGAF